MKTWIFLAFLALAGCEKKDEAQTNPSASSASPSASAATVTSAAATASDVPSEEDFEDEAEKDITPDNLEAQLTALEKEVDSP